MKPALVFALVGLASALAIRHSIDSDEAVVYPAEIDQSWIDSRENSAADSDEAVVYPAEIDQSWIDARDVDSDEAVVYPAEIDQSWIDTA
ncbi:hypothetical protein GGS24DRAFT_482892 [Hypoxylon argillaceum]|nr:hypothetical protein GGS24DRAFT_482892 [Hypoxylon argillaceum]KAI1144998.1 hypothetical protein F4825DRAFT_475093 [Nemania diffusa]